MQGEDLKREDKNIKLLLIDPGGEGGCCQYVYSLGQMLSQKGIDVTLLTSSDYELQHLPHHFKFNKDVRWMRGSKCNKFVRTIKLNSFLNVIFFIYAITKYFFQILKGKYNIVHYHGIYVPILTAYAFFLLKLSKVPLVFTPHNVKPRKEFSGWFAQYKYIFKKADMIYFHSEKAKNEAVELYKLPSEKICVIPMGNYDFLLDLDNVKTKSDARKLLRINDDSKVILFFGYIRPDKGLAYLIKAMSDVVKIFPDTILLVAGKDMGYTEKYKDLVHRLNIKKNVIFDLRYIPINEVGRYFLTSDIVVVPYTFLEQSAIVQTAYSFSKPVIATDIAGLPEVVKNGETGFLVKPKDSESLSGVIIKVFSDNNLLEKLSQNAKEFSIIHSSWDTIAENIIDDYQKVLR